jgi:excisionase family DNA binding protein
VPVLSLKEAASAVGVSRQTLYRYAESGRISVVQRRDGTQGVDTSELLRVFGELRQPETVTVTGGVTNQDSPDTALLQAAQRELEATKKLLQMTQDALEAAQSREGRLLGILENQTRLLEHKPRPVAAKKRPAVAKQRKVVSKKKPTKKKGKKASRRK